jgi:hypothetical protein
MKVGEDLVLTNLRAPVDKQEDQLCRKELSECWESYSLVQHPI